MEFEFYPISFNLFEFNSISIQVTCNIIQYFYSNGISFSQHQLIFYHFIVIGNVQQQHKAQVLF
jgi:hypothetical protein